MLKIAVMVSGSGTNLQAIIDKIEQNKLQAEIVTVISNNPASFALERAKNHNINAICIRKKDFPDEERYEEAMIRHLKNRGAELIVLAGFLVVLKEKFISAYRNRIMNIHPSLIPAFCGDGCYGIKVHEAALRYGVKITGATVHFVDEGTDTGPIVLQKAVEVRSGDTAEILQKRVMEEAEWLLLPEAIRLFSENRLLVKENKVYIEGKSL